MATTTQWKVMFHLNARTEPTLPGSSSGDKFDAGQVVECDAIKGVLIGGFMVKMVHVVTPDCWLFDQSVRNLTKGIDKVHIVQVRDDAAPPTVWRVDHKIKARTSAMLPSEATPHSFAPGATVKCDEVQDVELGGFIVKFVHVIDMDCWIYTENLKNLKKGVSKIHITQVFEEEEEEEEEEEAEDDAATTTTWRVLAEGGIKSRTLPCLPPAAGEAKPHWGMAFKKGDIVLCSDVVRDVHIEYKGSLVKVTFAQAASSGTWLYNRKPKNPELVLCEEISDTDDELFDEIEGSLGGLKALFALDRDALTRLSEDLSDEALRRRNEMGLSVSGFEIDYETFMDTGKLALWSGVSEGEETDTKRHEKLSEIFHVYARRNVTGEVAVEEIVSGMSLLMGEHDAAETVEAIFEMYDADANGGLEEAELRDYLMCTYTFTNITLNDIDKLDEAGIIARAKVGAVAMLEAMDTDNNGSISKKEFIHFFKAHAKAKAVHTLSDFSCSPIQMLATMRNIFDVRPGDEGHVDNLHELLSSAADGDGMITEDAFHEIILDELWEGGGSGDQLRKREVVLSRIFAQFVDPADKEENLAAAEDLALGFAALAHSVDAASTTHSVYEVYDVNHDDKLDNGELRHFLLTQMLFLNAMSPPLKQLESTDVTKCAHATSKSLINQFGTTKDDDVDCTLSKTEFMVLLEKGDPHEWFFSNMIGDDGVKEEVVPVETKATAVNQMLATMRTFFDVKPGDDDGTVDKLHALLIDAADAEGLIAGNTYLDIVLHELWERDDAPRQHSERRTQVLSQIFAQFMEDLLDDGEPIDAHLAVAEDLALGFAVLAHKADVDTTARSIFEVYDVNHDHKLDDDELCHYLSTQLLFVNGMLPPSKQIDPAVVHGYADGTAKQLIKQFGTIKDDDADCNLSEREFLILLEQGDFLQDVIGETFMLLLGDVMVDEEIGNDDDDDDDDDDARGGDLGDDAVDAEARRIFDARRATLAAAANANEEREREAREGVAKESEREAAIALREKQSAAADARRAELAAAAAAAKEVREREEQERFARKLADMEAHKRAAAIALREKQAAMEQRAEMEEKTHPNEAQSATIILDQNFEDFNNKGPAYHEEHYAALADTLAESLGVDVSRIEIIGHARGSLHLLTLIKPDQSGGGGGGAGVPNVTSLKQKMMDHLHASDSTLRQSHLLNGFTGTTRHDTAEMEKLKSKRLQNFVNSIRPTSVAAFDALVNALLHAEGSCSVDDQVDLTEFSDRLTLYVRSVHRMGAVQKCTIESIFRAADVGADSSSDTQAAASLSIAELKCALVTMFSISPTETSDDVRRQGVAHGAKVMFNACAGSSRRSSGRGGRGSGGTVLLQRSEFEVAFLSMSAVNKLLDPGTVLPIGAQQHTTPDSEFAAIKDEINRAKGGFDVAVQGLTKSQFCAWFIRVNGGSTIEVLLERAKAIPLGTVEQLEAIEKVQKLMMPVLMERVEALAAGTVEHHEATQIVEQLEAVVQAAAMLPLGSEEREDQQMMAMRKVEQQMKRSAKENVAATTMQLQFKKHIASLRGGASQTPLTSLKSGVAFGDMDSVSQMLALAVGYAAWVQIDTELRERCRFELQKEMDRSYAGGVDVTSEDAERLAIAMLPHLGSVWSDIIAAGASAASVLKLHTQIVEAWRGGVEIEQRLEEAERLREEEELMQLEEELLLAHEEEQAVKKLEADEAIADADRTQEQLSTIIFDKDFDEFEAMGAAHHEAYYAKMAVTISKHLGIPLERVEIMGHDPRGGGGG